MVVVLAVLHQVQAVLCRLHHGVQVVVVSAETGHQMAHGERAE